MRYISVIIPTRNRCALLKKCLESLTNQSYSTDSFEVLVIDNGSTDDTRSVVHEFSLQIQHLRYSHVEKPGLHEGRHAGLKLSEGEILVFADDDIQALPTWLEGIQESFQNKEVGLVGGKNIPNYESDPPDWLESLWVTTSDGKYITYFSLLDFGDEPKVIHPYFVFGCNFSVRKDLLLQIKGFHPDGMPQSMLKYRGDGESHVAITLHDMGFKTMYNPKASVKHWVPVSRMNTDYINKRAFAEGITQSYIDTRKKFFDDKDEFARGKLAKQLKESIREFFLGDIKKQISRSFREGYKFHQAELSRDEDLRSWVVKDNYLT